MLTLTFSAGFRASGTYRVLTLTICKHVTCHLTLLWAERAELITILDAMEWFAIDLKYISLLTLNMIFNKTNPSEMVDWTCVLDALCGYIHPVVTRHCDTWSCNLVVLQNTQNWDRFPKTSAILEIGQPWHLCEELARLKASLYARKWSTHLY